MPSLKKVVTPPKLKNETFSIYSLQLWLLSLFKASYCLAISIAFWLRLFKLGIGFGLNHGLVILIACQF